MADVLVVQSKIKEMIKKAGCNTSAESIEAFSKAVEGLIRDAVNRCKANGRKTVKAQDI